MIFVRFSGYIEYRFEDPNEGTLEEVNARRKNLAEQGIGPTRLRVKGVDGTEEKYIYPFAMVHYKGRTLKVNLLENEIAGKSDEMILNNSVSLLEYKFANAIQKLEHAVRKVVVFILPGMANSSRCKSLIFAKHSLLLTMLALYIWTA